MEIQKTKPISFASDDPIRDLLKALVDQTAARRRYLGRKVSAQAIMNGLILLVGEATGEDRERIVDRALALIGKAELGELTDGDVVAMANPSHEASATKPKRKSS